MRKISNTPWGVLEKEKAKLTFSLPFKLHFPIQALLRFQMGREIKKYFTKHQLNKKFGKQTLCAAIEFTSHLYRLSPFFGKLHKLFLKYLTHPSFVDLHHRYCDTFTTAIIESLQGNHFNAEEALKLPQHLEKLIEFYQSRKFKNIYNAIWKDVLKEEDKNKRDEVCRYYACIFDKLSGNQKLLDQYSKFLGDIAENKKILEVLKTIHLISLYVGTNRAYETFLKFCKKFNLQMDFEEVVQIAGKITLLRDPKIFQQAFSWAISSNLSPEAITKAFIYSLPLLQETNNSNSQFPQYSSYSYQKYLTYVQTKEANLMHMETDKVQYYLQKAVEFFVEQ